MIGTRTTDFTCCIVGLIFLSKTGGFASYPETEHWNLYNSLEAGWFPVIEKQNGIKSRNQWEVSIVLNLQVSLSPARACPAIKYVTILVILHSDSCVLNTERIFSSSDWVTKKCIDYEFLHCIHWVKWWLYSDKRVEADAEAVWFWFGVTCFWDGHYAVSRQSVLPRSRDQWVAKKCQRNLSRLIWNWNVWSVSYELKICLHFVAHRATFFQIFI